MTWTLRKKILLGNGIVVLLLAVVIGWTLMNLMRLGRASDAILSENYQSIIAAEHMINALERQDSGVLLYLMGREADGAEQFRRNQNEFAQYFARAEDNITIDGEQAIIARIDSTFNVYTKRFTRLLNQPDTLDGDPYADVMLPAFRDVRAASGELRNLNQMTMVAASNRAAGVAGRAMWSVGLIGLGALVLGVVFSLILAGRIVRPIRQMRAATQQIAAGNYDVTVDVDTSDELGQLAEQFNEMTAQLRTYRDLNIEKIVAEQRKNEAIIESIDDGLIVVDADYNVLNLNPAAERALDTRRTAAEGRHFLEVFNDEALFEQVKQVAQSGAPSAKKGRDNMLSIERGDTTRHYQLLVNPVRGPEDEMLGVIVMLRDVTELEQVNRMKSEFVATASHELKTPITSIGMSVGLLEERLQPVMDERDRQLIEAASEDVQRLRGLVDDLLDLSKIESGRMVMEFDTVPVELLFEKATQTLQQQAHKQSIDLRASVPDDLPAIKADANKITWVLNNLISNALRYTVTGGHIVLAAEAIGSAVHCSVTDDGAGIPYEYQSKIFDKFVQVDSEQGQGGTGLGLAICREIIHAHGGRIWVDSTPGEGSTFTFTLPQASGPTHSSGARETRAEDLE